MRSLGQLESWYRLSRERVLREEGTTVLLSNPRHSPPPSPSRILSGGGGGGWEERKNLHETPKGERNQIIYSMYAQKRERKKVVCVLMFVRMHARAFDAPSTLLEIFI